MLANCGGSNSPSTTSTVCASRTHLDGESYAVGTHRCGSDSAIRLFLCVGSRVGTPFRWAYRSCSFSRADWIRLMTAAARCPPRSEPANSQFERPIAQVRMWFSTQLSWIGASPSSRQ